MPPPIEVTQCFTLPWLLTTFEPLLEFYSTVRNIDGETPLEAFEAALEKSRVQAGRGYHISDFFECSSTNSIECLASFQDSYISPTRRVCMKFGCTCSQFINGFLSPSVRFVLRNIANEQHGLLSGLCHVDDREEFFSSFKVARDFHFLLPSLQQHCMGARCVN